MKVISLVLRKVALVIIALEQCMLKNVSSSVSLCVCVHMCVLNNVLLPGYLENCPKFWKSPNGFLLCHYFKRTQRLDKERMRLKKKERKKINEKVIYETFLELR